MRIPGVKPHHTVGALEGAQEDRSFLAVGQLGLAYSTRMYVYTHVYNVIHRTVSYTAYTQCTWYTVYIVYRALCVAPGYPYVPYTRDIHEDKILV